MNKKKYSKPKFVHGRLQCTAYQATFTTNGREYLLYFPTGALISITDATGWWHGGLTGAM